MPLRLLLAGLLTTAVLFATTAGPAPLCVAGTLASYIALGPGGCVIAGDVNVSGFSFSVLASDGATRITAADIDVTPTLSAGGRFGLNFASDGFSVTGNESVTYELIYTFDPSDIRSLDDVLYVDSPVAPGFVVIDTTACLGASFSPLCPTVLAPPIQVSHDGVTFVAFDSTPIIPPQQVLGVRNVIHLNGGGTGSADFASFENRVEAVPEPGAAWLGGLGLALVLYLQRRQTALHGRPHGRFRLVRQDRRE
jgi:hypothetical protein